MSEIYRNKIRPRAKKIAIGVVAFFAVFTLAGFFGLPPLLKYVLVRELSTALHRAVTVDRVKTNPYTLSVTARGLTIKERAGADTFVSCDEIYLNIESFSVLRLAPVLKEVTLTKPYVKIIRNRDLSYNFSDLLTKSDSKPLKFALNNIRIENGSIDFSDEPKQTKHTVREMGIGIPFLSNIPSYVGRFVQPHFSARIDGALYTIKGKTKPFTDSLETSVDVDIKDLDIPYYLAYVPMEMKFRVLSGYVDVGAKVSFIESKDKKPALTVSGDVALKKVAVNDKEQAPFFRLSRLDVSIAPSEPLSGIIHLAKVSIQSPEFEIRRDKSGVLNIQSLLPADTGPAPSSNKKTGGSPPLSLDIDNIQLAAGKLSFSDLTGKTPFKTDLNPIEFKADHFSNGRDKKVAYALSLETEAKETLKVQGWVSLDPLASEGTIEVAAVPLKKYAPFYGDMVLFTIEDGRLDFGTRYSYAKGEKEPAINLSGLSVSLAALRLRKTGEKGDFLKIPALSIAETDLDLAKKVLKVGSFSTQKGELLVRRSNKGDLNLLNLIPTSAVPKEPPGGPRVVGKPGEPVQPWVVSLGQALVDKYSVRVEDRTTTDPVTLTVQDLRIKGENFSTAKNSRAKIDLYLLLNRKGSISTSGTFGMEPLSGDLKVGVKGIDIAPFQPYFTDKVRMTVTGGTVSTNGTLSFAPDRKGRMKTAYKGEASLNSFSSIDKASGEDLVKLGYLSLSNMGVNLEPLSINIKGVSLTNFYALISVSPEGRINLQDVLTPEGPAAAATPVPARPESQAAPGRAEGPAKDIRIEQVTLQGGRIDFLDRSVKPEFTTRVSEMGGRVSGLSAEQNTTADVELRAKLNDYAPLEITGKINPLRDDLFVDLKARINDLDLGPASPYSGKYAGYAIEKGKLSVDVKYLISKGKLDSQNSVFIDQFNFGDRVESPQATKLPVRLAVALLKDRKGEIKLDLPVTGSLDDPKFSVWGIIVKIIVNLIAKAATSPFALLGAAFGGGEELSFVEFDYGSATIADAGIKKLDTVSKALQDHPALKLEIEGYADAERDKEGLKQFLLNRKIKAQKLNEMTKKGQPVPPVDEVKIEPAEYEKYLRMAYKAEKFPKPKNLIGMAKELPVPEMEKLILTHTEVTDGDLRALASQRAMKAKDVILKSGQVEPERVFIVEAKSLAPEKKGTTKESRVDFKLK